MRSISRRAVMFLAGGLLLTACDAAAAQENRPAPEPVVTPDTSAPEQEPRGEPVGWHAARLEKPGSRNLIVHFWGGGPQDAPVGPCNPRYVGDAELDGGVVTVTVRAHAVPTDEPVMCTLIAHHRTLTVELPAPLRGDTVVNGASGETMPVFDVNALRTPTYLPEGYEFRGEDFPVGPTRNTRTWEASDAESLMVSVTDRDAEPFEPNENTVILAETRVHGQPATVWKSQDFDDNVTVSWTEGDHFLEVSSLGSPTAPLPVHEILRVARGLR